MGSNTSYSSPKVEMRNSRISGRGLFAKQLIQKGELIISFENGKGKFINSNEADRLYNDGNDHMLQVKDDLFFAATIPGEYEKEDHINHSCEPNLGIDGSVKFVAMRDIREGEELTFDYAMSESSNYEMKCHCGNNNCRNIITGNDWKLKSLQEKYNGYFSDYLQSKLSVQNSL